MKYRNILNIINNFVFLGIVYFLAASTAGASPGESDTNQLRALMHTLNYLSVDYPATVADGKIVDREEYNEQQEMAQHAMGLLRQLPESQQKAQLLTMGQQLIRDINERVPGDTLQSLCRNMHNGILTAYRIEIAPRQLPPMETATSLYQENCSACHGINGFGDGVMATSMEPKPANFHDQQRQSQMSVFGLYNTITLGVGDTGMRAFTELGEAQRWALAFYIANLLANDSERAEGTRLWQKGGFASRFNSLEDVVQMSPQTAFERWGREGMAVLAYLRKQPDAVMSAQVAPLEISRQRLSQSLQSYRKGNSQLAYEQSVSAYLDGFELIEKRLDALSPELKQEIEHAMISLRRDIQAKSAVAELEVKYGHLSELLDRADQALSAKVSSWTNFFTAFLILLREGIEAILVLAAIAAFVVQAGVGRGMRYVHTGWMSALLAGILTWLVADSFIRIDSSNREFSEGLIAIVTAAMLIYVGFWLHSHANSRQWQEFVRNKISNTVKTGSLWGLSLVAFLAVYREVFESILFYQSLWVQTGTGGHSDILYGMLVAAFMLLLIAWLVFRVSVRLPLQLFFRVNAALLFVLALVFTGKGIAALQEAGALRVDPLQFPQIDLLGIYPNAESLGAQLGLILLMLTWLVYSRYKSSRTVALP